MIAVTGDWPWLHRCGSLCRSFNNVPKKTGDKMTGICHRCCAGTLDVPWEAIHERDPVWLRSTFSESAFARVPAVSRLLCVPGQEEGILCFDLFHAYHLGVGKHFIGSALAVLSYQFPGRGVDERFQNLEADFFSWCKLRKQVPILTRLSKDTILWSSTNEFPSGNWFKGSVTTILSKYLEETLCSRTWPQEPMLEKAGEAIKAMNSCLSSLYAADLFLDPSKAVETAEHGLRFLRRLSWLAKHALNEQRTLWLLTPKAHILHHLFLEDMLLPALRGVSPLNALGLSVQMDEDFICKGSRLARRVDPRTCSKRVLQRYLCSAYAEYIKTKYILPRS